MKAACRVVARSCSEGEASSFRPDGSGKYTLLGRVQIVDWVTTSK